MNKTLLVSGAFFGLTAVIFGAFGAHGLKNILTSEAIKTFETGVKYQMYHALLLLFVGINTTLSQSAKTMIFYFVVTGIILFSGSIYGLSTNELTSINFKKIGFVTPIGGLLLIIGWTMLLYYFFKMKS